MSAHDPDGTQMIGKPAARMVGRARATDGLIRRGDPVAIGAAPADSPPYRLLQIHRRFHGRGSPAALLSGMVITGGGLVALTRMAFGA